MSIELLIYLADVVGKLHQFLYYVSLLGICVAIVVYIGHKVNDEFDGNTNYVNKPTGLVIVLFLGLMLISCFIPYSRTIYMIAGASYSKEALQSETEVKIKKLIDGKLDEALAELEKK